MRDRWLILADDLTGAADAAIAFARRGISASVAWGEQHASYREGIAVVAYDTDSRRLSAADAAVRQACATRQLLSPDRALYKKIDSTLRGQPAAEIAAVCAELRACSRPGFAIFAPANPPMGRTTRDGRVFVHGQRLEDTETWRREHSYPDADLAAMIVAAGLRAIKLPLAKLRANHDVLTQELVTTIRTAAGLDSATVLVCDAETDDDLARLVDAARGVEAGLYVGTAGLANALAAQTPAAARALPDFHRLRSGALIVVGSLSSVSHSAARVLADLPGIRRVRLRPEILLSDSHAAKRAQISREVCSALDAGIEVLVDFEPDAAPDLSRGAELARALATCLGPAMIRMSGLIATGGETAAALLAGCYVSGIRLVDEVEAGIALGITLGDVWIPVITKPGAFGSEQSLVRSLERLRRIRQTGTMA